MKKSRNLEKIDLLWDSCSPLNNFWPVPDVTFSSTSNYERCHDRGCIVLIGISCSNLFQESLNVLRHHLPLFVDVFFGDLCRNDVYFFFSWLVAPASMSKLTPAERSNILHRMCELQLTRGCENKTCTNHYCANCEDFEKPTAETMNTRIDELVSIYFLGYYIFLVL